MRPEERVSGNLFIGPNTTTWVFMTTILLGNRFPLKMKGKVCRCCVRSAILYGSETWCLKENEKAIFRRTERAMCGQKVVDRKTTEEQMDMLVLKETIDRLATANGVR